MTDHASPDWAAIRRDPRWVLLPLRLFLGITFLYAGLSKIAQRSFLDSSSPTSMHASVLAVRSSSPIGGLLGPVLDHSFAFGLLMAAAETAVGIGTLLGLLTRIASLGGMALAFSLFLTVSWGADPWYTGADIVYVFAFTPLLLAGLTPFSVDAWLASAHRRHPGAAEDRTRRAVLAGSAALAGLLAIGGASLLRAGGSTSAAGPTPAPTPSGGAAAPGAATPSGSATTPSGSAGSAAASAPSAGRSATGGAIPAAEVPVGGAKEVTDASSGKQVWVLQLEADRFTALSAVCPHQGCAVDFVSKSAGFICPCHRSAFDSTGAVTRGPAQTGLTKVAVSESGGQVTIG